MAADTNPPSLHQPTTDPFVHWFRGGFPEWRGTGLPIDKDG